MDTEVLAYLVSNLPAVAFLVAAKWLIADPIKEELSLLRRDLHMLLMGDKLDKL